MYMINLLASKPWIYQKVTSYKQTIKSGVRSTTVWGERVGKLVDAG